MAFVFVRKYAILLAAQNKDPGAAVWCGDIGRSVVGLKRGARAKRPGCNRLLDSLRVHRISGNLRTLYRNA